MNTILLNNRAGKAGLEMYAATGSIATLRHCVVKAGKAGLNVLVISNITLYN